MRAYRGEVKALSDLLGDDDDLEVMHAILVERPAPLGVACQFNGVLNLIECCQAQLKAEAQMLSVDLCSRRKNRDALRIVLVDIGELGRRMRNVVGQRKDRSIVQTNERATT